MFSTSCSEASLPSTSKRSVIAVDTTGANSTISSIAWRSVRACIAASPRKP
jgi:hypothetical protein